jgi:hypothetical protein
VQTHSPAQRQARKPFPAADTTSPALALPRPALSLDSLYLCDCASHGVLTPVLRDSSLQLPSLQNTSHPHTPTPHLPCYQPAHPTKTDITTRIYSKCPPSHLLGLLQLLLLQPHHQHLLSRRSSARHCPARHDCQQAAWTCPWAAETAASATATHPAQLLSLPQCCAAVRPCVLLGWVGGLIAALLVGTAAAGDGGNVAWVLLKIMCLLQQECCGFSWCPSKRLL